GKIPLNRTPFLPQRLDIERGHINRRRNSPRRCLETIEHLIDCREVRVLIEESFIFQRTRNFSDQITSASGGVGKCSQNPHGRSAERKNSNQLDAVSCSPPH